jgi:hypothetical protein
MQMALKVLGQLFTFNPIPIIEVFIEEGLHVPFIPLSELKGKLPGADPKQ